MHQDVHIYYFKKYFLKKIEDFCRFNSKYVFLLGFFYFDQFIVQFSIWELKKTEEIFLNFTSLNVSYL
jgi:hypothetical protein